jgi:hypothetical protein
MTASARSAAAKCAGCSVGIAMVIWTSRMLLCPNSSRHVMARHATNFWGLFTEFFLMGASSPRSRFFGRLTARSDWDGCLPRPVGQFYGGSSTDCIRSLQDTECGLDAYSDVHAARGHVAFHRGKSQPNQQKNLPLPARNERGEGPSQITRIFAFGSSNRQSYSGHNQD